MAKYSVETYYTCSFKVSHYLDDINESELSKLEKRDDGKFEILDIKLDSRKTKNLNTKINKNNIENNIVKLLAKVVRRLSMRIIGSPVDFFLYRSKLRDMFRTVNIGLFHRDVDPLFD